MTLDEAQLATVGNAVEALVSGDADRLQPMLAHPQDDIYRWTRDYGSHGEVRLMTPPGQPADWQIDVIPIEGSEAVAVVVPMWTREEGRSDLSLELTLSRAPGAWVAEINGLHVL